MASEKSIRLKKALQKVHASLRNRFKYECQFCPRHIPHDKVAECKLKCPKECPLTLSALPEQKRKVRAKKKQQPKYLPNKYCPVCHYQLLFIECNNVFEVWCGNPDCPSVIANSGAESAILADAVGKLRQKLKRTGAI